MIHGWNRTDGSGEWRTAQRQLNARMSNVKSLEDGELEKEHVGMGGMQDKPDTQARLRDSHHIKTVDGYIATINHQNELCPMIHDLHTILGECLTWE